MKCIRCGTEMKEEDRCCLRCGTLNYTHPLNTDYIQKYGDKKEYKEVNTFGFKKRNARRKKLFAFFLFVIIGFLIGIFFLLK